MKSLREILNNAGKSNCYYEVRVPVDLWRAKKLGSIEPVFNLIEHRLVRNNGKIRPADVSLYERNGIEWISIKDRPRGLSVFDKKNVFSRGEWCYYKIPAGTILPSGLAIVDDGLNPAVGARHYTIAPSHDMPLSQFRQLLNVFAQNLVKETA